MNRCKKFFGLCFFILLFTYDTASAVDPGCSEVEIYNYSAFQLAVTATLCNRQNPAGGTRTVIAPHTHSTIEIRSRSGLRISIHNRGGVFDIGTGRAVLVCHGDNGAQIPIRCEIDMPEG